MEGRAGSEAGSRERSYCSVHIMEPAPKAVTSDLTEQGTGCLPQQSISIHPVVLQGKAEGHSWVGFKEHKPAKHGPQGGSAATLASGGGQKPLGIPATQKHSVLKTTPTT